MFDGYTQIDIWGPTRTLDQVAVAYFLVYSHPKVLGLAINLLDMFSCPPLPVVYWFDKKTRPHRAKVRKRTSVTKAWCGCVCVCVVRFIGVEKVSSP